MRPSRKLVPLALVLLAMGGLARRADAFCRLTVGCGQGTGNAGDNCDSPVDTCTADALAWKEGCVSYSVDMAGSALRHITYEEGVAAVQGAFDAWLAPNCDGESPGLGVQDLGPSASAPRPRSPRRRAPAPR
jgi:hypothetical protein